MRKKATEYSLWLVFITAILVFTIITMLWAKFSIYNEKVGTTQFSLMDAYEKAENVQNYIDFSTKLAFMQALYEGANTGFLYNWVCDSERPSYYGYKLLNTPSKNCVANVKGTVTYRLINLLKTYTGVFPNDGIPYPIYNFYFFEDSPGFNLYGRYNRGLKLEINDEQELLLSESTYRLRNKVSETTREITFTGSCGENLVEIAEKGIGHPYFLGSREWPSDELPPTDSNCRLPSISPELEELGWTANRWRLLTRETGRCTIDCSSFTKWVYNYYSEKTGDDSFFIQERNANWQAHNIGKPVDHDPTLDVDNYASIIPNCDELQKGDLIFFADTHTEGISHVGIYYGDCQFIHAGSPVQIDSLEEDHWNEHYIGAKRVCEDENSESDEPNLITGSVVSEIEDITIFDEFDFIPKAPDEEIYEQYESCEKTGGQICNYDEDCFGTQVLSADSTECCIGECKHEFEARETPPEFVPEEIVEEEVNVEEVIIQEPERSYKTIIIVILLIFVIIGIVYYIKKNKLIVFSLFFVLILVVGLFIFVPDKDKITGRLTYEELSDQQKKVCQVANAYNIPGTILLTIAQKESGGNHYRNDGTVKVSGDGGVGIMQITGRRDCGNSEIDGHPLDIYKLNDNIECGAKILLEKCNAFNCRNPSANKPYDCDNSEFPSLDNKHVVYSGWDMALRGYNGWGCRAPAFENEPNYEDIVRRVQNYVEDFHTQASQFQGACPGDIEWNPSNTDSADEVTTVLDLEALSQLMSETDTGYYFLNPEINEEFDFDFTEIHNDMSFASNQLITEVKECAFYDYTCHGRLPSGTICYDENGVPLTCDDEGQILDCYTNTDGYQIAGEYVCELEFNQPTCLDQDNNPQYCEEDRQELSCRDLTKTYRECVLEVLDNNGKTNWNLDYCKNNLLAKNCYDSGKVWNGVGCIDKPEGYDESKIFKFCIDTDAEAFIYEDNAYKTKPVDVKFALTMHTGGARQQSVMEYDEIEDVIVIDDDYPSGYSGETYHGTYMEIYEKIKNDMGSSMELYPVSPSGECQPPSPIAYWCWRVSGSCGNGIYCKEEALTGASIAQLNTLFRHELTHSLQGSCGGTITNGLGVRSEWGAEYYSGSTYYRFKVKGQWLTAQQLGEAMKNSGCSESMLMNAAFCKGGAYAQLGKQGCILGNNGDIAESVNHVSNLN